MISVRERGSLRVNLMRNDKIVNLRIVLVGAEESIVDPAHFPAIGPYSPEYHTLADAVGVAVTESSE